MLKKIDDISNKRIVFGGDFKLFFEAKLEAQEGNPVMKKKSLPKLIQIQEKIALILGELETQTRIVILFINNTLQVIFKEDFSISNVLQEYLKKPNILPAFSTDHSPIMFSLFTISEETGGKGLWKHNNSSCEKSTYIHTMKKHISTLENLKNEMMMSRVCGNIQNMK